MFPDRLRVLLPVFFAAQGLFVYLASGTERPPAPPALSEFPVAFSDWSRLRDDPVDGGVVQVLRADRLLNRTYINPATGSTASLFVAWFQSQRGGASQPHSPKVCLPGSGWIPQANGELGLSTPDGEITVNRYLVANGNERAVVLYWYQTPRRVIAGEWASKLWVLADALRDHRTDTALVRIVVWSAPGGDQAATETAAGFTRSLYPVLREQLPR